MRSSRHHIVRTKLVRLASRGAGFDAPWRECLSREEGGVEELKLSPEASKRARASVHLPGAIPESNRL